MRTLLISLLLCAAAMAQFPPIEMPNGVARDDPVGVWLHFVNACRAGDTTAALSLVDLRPPRMMAMVEATVPSLAAIEKLKHAMAQRWGVTHIEEINMGFYGPATLATSKAKIDGDVATVEMTHPQFDDVFPAMLVRVDGQWKLSDFGDRMLDPPTQEEVSDEEWKALAQQTALVTEHADKIAKRVEAGEFDQPEEAQDAFQASLFKALTQAAE